MGERNVVSMRLHPRVQQVLKSTAQGLGRSLGYLVEMMAVSIYGPELQGFDPGRRVGDDERYPDTPEDS
jgi:hypothetical protein